MTNVATASEFILFFFEQLNNIVVCTCTRCLQVQEPRKTSKDPYGFHINRLSNSLVAVADEMKGNKLISSLRYRGVQRIYAENKIHRKLVVDLHQLLIRRLVYTGTMYHFGLSEFPVLKCELDTVTESNDTARCVRCDTENEKLKEMISDLMRHSDNIEISLSFTKHERFI
ncbi:hypothetical protein Bhyg_10164 [Pseudolycoriella hygida]|uniref:Uncharacterized protein n=1 Tax=Pseudolycoriella hygida TaxID=35572 RepID=A0A9Q0MUQ6_9DIPT|nr:hypothetical protein Bhyg_10164 [Pseudolycoriella hygida]